jgi:hypothetical protein
MEAVRFFAIFRLADNGPKPNRNVAIFEVAARKLTRPERTSF